MTYPRRHERLEAVLRDAGAGAALVSDPASIRYLCGFSGSSGVLWVPTDAAPSLITDFRYEEQAGAEVWPATEVRIAKGGWIRALEDRAEGAPGVLAFDPDRLTVSDHRKLGETLPATRLVPVPRLASGLRSVKDEDEIEAIARAATLAEAALERTLASIAWSEGPRETDVAARLTFELRSAGSESLPFEVIAASGSRTALPHATPSARRIEPGDLVLLDFGARVDGYCSDITRTFVVGPPAGWQSELHGRVREAQRLAIEAIGPGVPCAEVDAAAREELARHGWDRYFGHSTGHGIGLEVHEGPSLSSRSEDTLESGNVVTVEPGVYLPARGGVRIEDDVRVGEDGARRLTAFPRDLMQL